MPKRVRNSSSSSSFIFFWLWATLRPSPASPKTVTLDGLGQNDGRLPVLHLRRHLVGRVDLFRIVATATHLFELFVAVVLDQLQQFGILAEEVLANVAARHPGVLLVLAVDDFVHPLGEQTGRVFGQQMVPVVTPDDFDHVPAGTAEDRFQFLNDLAVAANRTVESLQVAVDHEDQVVELFTGSQVRSHRAFPVRRIHRRPGTPRLFGRRCL